METVDLQITLKVSAKQKLVYDKCASVEGAGVDVECSPLSNELCIEIHDFLPGLANHFYLNFTDCEAVFLCTSAYVGVYVAIWDDNSGFELLDKDTMFDPKVLVEFETAIAAVNKFFGIGDVQ